MGLARQQIIPLWPWTVAIGSSLMQNEELLRTETTAPDAFLASNRTQNCGPALRLWILMIPGVITQQAIATYVPRTINLAKEFSTGSSCRTTTEKMECCRLRLY